MDVLTLERVVPTIAASVSWLTFGITLSGLDSFAEVREEQEEGLAGQAALAKEAPSLQHPDDGFLSSRGDDGELDLAGL